jgi:hypothetical protein
MPTTYTKQQVSDNKRDINKPRKSSPLKNPFKMEGYFHFERVKGSGDCDMGRG